MSKNKKPKINKRLAPEDRYPPIPCKKVMPHGKDKLKTRKARRAEERKYFYNPSDE